MQSRLFKKYQEEVVPVLMKQFGYKNQYQVPRMEKIVINMGIGAALQDAKYLDMAMSELEMIVGQKPVITYAKTSIAGFKLREGSPVGCKVTLRRDRMYEFFDRLVNVAMPRIKDFRGMKPKSFDGNGNYTFGLKDQLIFPEIELDKVKRMQGMDIIIQMHGDSDEGAKGLLTGMGMPFRE